MADLWNEDILGEKRVQDAKDAAIKFEAIKVHYRQTKEGNNLGLQMSPHDTPQDIILAPLGQRFLVVMVPIDDHEQPVVSPEKRDTEEWIRLCGIICNDIEFQQWLVDQGAIETLSADDAAQFIRDYCNVSSRAQFRDKPEALKKWKLVHGAYVNKGSL